MPHIYDSFGDEAEVFVTPNGHVQVLHGNGALDTGMSYTPKQAKRLAKILRKMAKKAEKR